MKSLYLDFNGLVTSLILSKELPTSGSKRSSLPNLNLGPNKKKKC